MTTQTESPEVFSTGNDVTCREVFDSPPFRFYEVLDAEGRRHGYLYFDHDENFWIAYDQRPEDFHSIQHSRHPNRDTAEQAVGDLLMPGEWLPLEKIGAMYRQSRATVSDWLMRIGLLDGTGEPTKEALDRQIALRRDDVKEIYWHHRRTADFLHRHDQEIMGDELL